MVGMHMKLGVVICDDYKESRYILRRYIEKLNIKQVKVVAEAQDGNQLIDICRSTLPDIILLDIDMPGMGGIEAAKKIVKFLPNVSLIFITAYKSFAIEAFEVYPVDYILKPISIERLGKSINRIVKKKSKDSLKSESRVITFLSNREAYNINQESILFIERVDRKTLIHTLQGALETCESLNSVYEKLDSKIFERVHRSYIINKVSNFKIQKDVGRTRQIAFKGYDKFAYISRKNFKYFTESLKLV